jgi:hypothetical protein
MKNLLIIIIILLSVSIAFSQSLVIETGAEVNVVTTADLCVQNGTITGNITGTGTLCGAPTFLKYDSVSPNQNKLNISLTSVIIAYFNQNMNGPTMNNNNITFYGSMTGKKQGTITYNSGNYSMQLVPNYPFKFGELISTTLDTGIKSSFGNSISPFVWSFTTMSNPANAVFAQTSNPSAGTDLESIVSADLDGDGDIDLAVANWTSNSVTVLKNNGSGIFSQSSTVSVGSNPICITSSDFDGDGDIDLAVTNYSSNTVSILINNGSGVFTETSTISVGISPFGIASADLDGDGDVDLVVCNFNSSSVSLLKNNGNGSFTHISAITAGSYPTGIAIGDFDKDGNNDLAVTNHYSSYVSILKNNGTGIFAISSSIEVGSQPYGITTSDLDGDGDLDLAVTNYTSHNISILKNNGEGIFTQSSIIPAESYPHGITSADLDGDGDIDLAVNAWQTGIIYIFKNSGNGAFTQSSGLNIGYSIYDITSADFDGDGDIDLASTNYTTGNVSILINISPPLLSSPANNSIGIICPVVFSWNKSLGAGNFKFQLATDSLFNNIIINDSTLQGTDTVKSVTELNPAPMYFWRMYSKSANGFSLCSETWRFDGTSLPVELISFNAIVEKNNVKLNWKTGSEINNRGFDIERKIISANEWEKITFITGKGNSSSLTHYLFEDKKLNTGKYIYRLKQIDFNGNFEYHMLNEDVKISPPEEFTLSQNYPNPFNPSTKIDFTLPANNRVTLKIYDITGREILVLLNNEFKTADYYTVNVNGNILASGVYFYRIQAGKFIEVKKMVLLK